MTTLDLLKYEFSVWNPIAKNNYYYDHKVKFIQHSSTCIKETKDYKYCLTFYFSNKFNPPPYYISYLIHKYSKEPNSVGGGLLLLLYEDHFKEEISRLKLTRIK